MGTTVASKYCLVGKLFNSFREILEGISEFSENKNENYLKYLIFQIFEFLHATGKKKFGFLRLNYFLKY